MNENCSASPDARHCMHVRPHVVNGIGAPVAPRCCWCGREEPQHGPYREVANGSEVLLGDLFLKFQTWPGAKDRGGR